MMNAVTNDTFEFAQAFADATGDQICIKADLKETELRLEAKIEASKAEILKWLFGTIGLQTFVILAAIVTLHKFVKP